MRVSQPKTSFGVQGRDVKQGPAEELQPSWIWRDVEEQRLRGRGGKQEGAKVNRPQDPAGMFANDFHSNPGQFAKKGSLLPDLCSVVVIYPLVLLTVHLPLPLLWAACIPTYHTHWAIIKIKLWFYFLCLIPKPSRFNPKYTLDQGFTGQQLHLAGSLGLSHSWYSFTGVDGNEFVPLILQRQHESQMKPDRAILKLTNASAP